MSDYVVTGPRSSPSTPRPATARGMGDSTPEGRISQRREPQGTYLLGGSWYIKNEDVSEQGYENHGLAEVDKPFIVMCFRKQNYIDFLKDAIILGALRREDEDGGPVEM